MYHNHIYAGIHLNRRLALHLYSFKEKCLLQKPAETTDYALTYTGTYRQLLPRTYTCRLHCVRTLPIWEGIAISQQTLNELLRTSLHGGLVPDRTPSSKRGISNKQLLTACS